MALTLACGVFACGLRDARAAETHLQQSATTPAPMSPDPAAQTAANKRATKLVTDETGRRMAIPLNVQRVVSLAPNLTETIYALGLDEARGRHDVLRYSAGGEGKAARRRAAGSEPGSDRRDAS
jgi:ABC-type Fe3+-hydroxamate transport system substrate-binding protein